MTTSHPRESIRPLPARPNLEFEKKRAKKMVKERDGSIKLVGAQLLIAREYGFTSWRKLSEFFNAWETRPLHSAEHTRTSAPILELQAAIREGDLAKLARLFAEHPAWRITPEAGAPFHSPAWDVIRLAANARGKRSQEMVPVLRRSGVDVQTYLNLALLGSVIPKASVSEIEGLLELGADAHWQPANGYSVLEHAIVRYGNGQAVDLIAKRVQPRKSFWVAAGVGDVPTMLQFLNDEGVPTDAARLHRPDPALLGTGGAMRADATDREIVWEAFMMAALNGRINTMKALLDRGFPVDYTPVWYNALHVSISYRLQSSIQFLREQGANIDYKFAPDQLSPRELAQNQGDPLR